jgi:hypothetical protein
MDSSGSSLAFARGQWRPVGKTQRKPRLFGPGDVTFPSTAFPPIIRRICVSLFRPTLSVSQIRRRSNPVSRLLRYARAAPPAGVQPLSRLNAAGKNRFMAVGDVLECGIEQLGRARSRHKHKIAYSGRTQSVRVRPSSSQRVGRAWRPVAASAASGSPPNSGKPPGKRTFTARLR